MTSKTPDTVTQQIAVILGTSGSGQPLLNILRRLLGKDAGTQLHGVFIENDELQQAAALPFVKELCRLTLSVREIHNTRFDRSIALRMRTARSAVEELARHMGVPHTFREAQGSTIRLLRETVHSSDVTVFEPLSKLAGPTIRQSVHGQRAPRRIVVVIDEVETGGEALLIAALLAESGTHRISILLRAETTVELEVMNKMINDLLPAGSKRLLLLSDHGVQHLIATVLAERADMLVLGASKELLKTESLGSLLKQLNCPICLVRHFDRGSTKPLPDSLSQD
jgi:hypothetical protein